MKEKTHVPSMATDSPTPIRVDGTKHIWVDIIGMPFTRYYFSDETSEFHGPWLTQGEAEAQLAWYCKYILG